MTEAKRVMNESQNISMYEACLLHSRADRTLRVIVGRQLDDFKLSMMEWLLLASVCNGPTSGMSMSEVAAVLDVTLPQVTALMNDLVAMKLVKQKVDAADRRSRKLMCTLQGKRLLGKVEHAINKAMRQWLQDVTHEEFQAYMNTVRLLATQQI